MGGVLHSDPGVGRNSDGRLEVFVLGSDDRLFHMWQDGTPLTADDFVFGMKVAGDLDFLQTTPPALKLISDVQAPDPHTVVVNWKQIAIGANAI